MITKQNITMLIRSNLNEYNELFNICKHSIINSRRELFSLYVHLNTLYRLMLVQLLVTLDNKNKLKKVLLKQYEYCVNNYCDNITNNFDELSKESNLKLTMLKIHMDCLEEINAYVLH